MSVPPPVLPIDAHLPAVWAALASSHCAVIVAPPGTGKTTRVAPALLPLAGLDRAGPQPVGIPPGCLPPASDFPSGQVLLVQPRRIAARAAAARIASELQIKLGELVGYQVRFDARISRHTQLVALTPGILLRKLQSDAVLSDVAAVVLDEFHERSLELDLLLGMIRRLQCELRPELRLLIMSATLDQASLQAYLQQPPVIEVAAATFPVRIVHSRFESPAAGRGPAHPRQKIIDNTVKNVLQASAEWEGDILAFLPGVGEIKRVEALLQPSADKAGWALLPLFGDMSPSDQDAVLAPNPRRKVILATNVAETSLTIDGVRIVIDSGWARVQRLDAAVGLNRLVLEPISKASAAQRAGRAGRTAPGLCLRLWDEVTGRSRADHLEPEVARVDLTGGVLELLCWGEADLEAFPWPTPPTPQALAQALRTLRYLGAVDDAGVTPLGRSMNRLPVHPRVARLLLAGHELRVPRAAALAAACLSEREIFDRHRRGASTEDAPPHDPRECDLTAQVIALQALARNPRRPATGREHASLNLGAAQHVLRVAQQLANIAAEELGTSTDEPLEDQLARCLIVAYPDRLARRRSPSDRRGLMAGGRGVQLEATSCVRRSELFICWDADAGGSEARVRQATGVEPQWLPAEFQSVRDERFFHPSSSAVMTRRRHYFLDLLLHETPIETPADEETARLLSRAAAERFERLLPPKDKPLHSLLDRIRWLSEALPDAPLPALRGEPLADTLAHWCLGYRKLDELKQLPWKQLLESLLPPAARKLLDQQAPESLQLPSGRVVWLQYETSKPPVLAARIQEFFGWRETPRLAGGRIPLLLHLLAPNGRVQQITDDLASFWKNTYPTVRKELRGRYPKHAWPEDPRAIGQ